MKKGRFIVFEGIDGSGKSTQIRLLAEKLEKDGRRVFRTAEPTQMTTGGLIRDALGGNYKRTAEELAAMFLADRISHNVNPNDGIIKCLNDGIDVISDRYYYSSFAYQGMESDLDWVIRMNRDCPSITKPDICFFIDVPANVCYDRVDGSRVSKEIFERDRETLDRIRKKYLDVFARLKDTDNIQTVVNEGKPEDVAELIYRKVKQI